jgi:phosphate transport system substrate-binding protein
MKRPITLLLAGLIALAAGAGATQAAGAGKKIVLEGSTTVLPIAQAAAEEFMNSHPDISINVRGGGSGVGITSLIEGTCDIADASRSMKDAELQKAAARGKNPKAHVIAMDGIVMVVNPSNPVSGFTKKQIQDIYTGRISNWSQAGGNNAKTTFVGW